MNWQPIQTAPTRDEVLFFFPAKVTGAYSKTVMEPMYRVGRLADFPHRKPTHWAALLPPAEGK